MGTREKILVGVLLGGGLYMILSRRSASASLPPSVSDRVMSYAGLMFRSGAEQGVDPALIASVMTVESGGDENAMGLVGEVGLMQILPSTGRWIADVSQAQLTVPAINIRTGTVYIRYSVDRKGGNVPAGIAGYNYGPDRVRIQGSAIIVPESVIQYVEKVLSLVKPYRALFKELMGDFYQVQFGSGRLILGGLNCSTCRMA